MIDTFATGDIDTAKELLAGDYIQHNFAYGTGRIKVQVNLLHLPTSVNFHQNITVYLAEFLLEKGYEVHGLIRRSSAVVVADAEYSAEEKAKFDDANIPVIYVDAEDDEL